MKIRKKYSIVINGNMGSAHLVRGNSLWARWMQRNATCGIRIWDCNLSEAVHNLKFLKYEKGLSIHKSKR